MASHKVAVSRLALWRIVAAALLIVFTVVPAAQAANVPRAYAGIVVDAKTGKVLYESDADEYRYPASVTKVMTLYVLFQELAAGKIKLSDKMTVSKHAAAAVPTKLGLGSGATITVENAIKALVTLSANDMARVIAEHVSGTESAFAKRMTATAKALGMKRTTYANASGLPDSRQVTTVRDQSILARAVYAHFPQYYDYFQTKSFTYGKRTYGNHNNLLGHNGVDGLKTGYINASGYNLMTAARTGNKHIVVIGFGFDKGATRDAKVRELVTKYLPKARAGSYLEVASIPVPGRASSGGGGGAVQVAAIPTPLPAPAFASLIVGGGEAPATPQFGVGDVTASTEVAVVPSPLPPAAPIGLPAAIGAVNAAVPSARPTIGDIIGSFTNAYLGAPPASLGETRPSAPLVPPVGLETEGEPLDLMTSGSVAVAAVTDVQPQAMPTALAPTAGWIVQIGAAPSENGATSLLGDAAGKISSLGSYQSFIQRFEKDGQTFYRARFGGFADQNAANDMCKQLKLAKMSCLAMPS